MQDPEKAPEKKEEIKSDSKSQKQDTKPQNESEILKNDEIITTEIKQKDENEIKEENPEKNEKENNSDENKENLEEKENEQKPGFRIEAKGAIKDDKDPINDTKKEDSTNPRYLLSQMYQRCDPSKQKDIIITKSEVIFMLGDTQRISIAKVNGKIELDFRSFHFDDVMFLAKYGLNMNLKDWDNLKKKMNLIDEAIYKLTH